MAASNLFITFLFTLCFTSNDCALFYALFHVEQSQKFRRHRLGLFVLLAPSPQASALPHGERAVGDADLIGTRTATWR